MPGTVGRMGSGRLVLVQSVEYPYRATLVELPEQPATIGHDFYSFLIENQKGFVTSPFIKLEPVEELGEVNKFWLEHGKLPEGFTARHREEPIKRKDIIREGRLVTGKADAIVPKYPSYQKYFDVVHNAVATLDKPTEDEVIAECIKRGLWAGKLGQKKAIHWSINQLVKAGCLRWL